MARQTDNACRLNDREREQWINNDEGLYRWYQSETRRRGSGGMRGFIRANKAEIDRAICRVLGREPLGGARRRRRRRAR